MIRLSVIMAGRNPLPAWFPPPHAPTLPPLSHTGNETDIWANVALTVADPTSPDHMIFEGVNTDLVPRFSIAETAKFFFRHNAQWIRVQERKCRLELDGHEIARHRTDKGARYYTLSDIEQMAHALFGHQAISWNQLRYTLALLNIQGYLWGFFI